MKAASPSTALATTVSLQGFVDYAVNLHNLLGDLELITRALELLLATSAAPSAAEALSAAAVSEWCLEGGGLCADGPAAVARALLLERAVASCSSSPSSATDLLAFRPCLLEASPAILAEASEPVAARVAGVLAACLPDDDEAAVFLASLRAAGDFAAYTRAAEALLAKHPQGRVWSEAWQVALEVLPGPNGCDRRACLQRLLPPLVAVTPRDEAARHLSKCIGSLLDGQRRAEVSDALGISVCFHSLLLEHWQLDSLGSNHDSLGERLIAAGLRFGTKENGTPRRHARFLLETASQAMLAKPEAEKILQGIAGVGRVEAAAAWRSYWELYDALEEYASHLLKASWEPCVGRMMRFLSSLRLTSAEPPPCLMSSRWLEVLFARALAHDNDTCVKFVLGNLVALDQATASLSESFVLGVVLPHLSQGIDLLYPRTDVRQVFEGQVRTFLLAFMRHHIDGAAVAARRLLLALLGLRAVHFTPLRVVLSALVELEGPGALEAQEALGIVEEFFTNKLMRMPVSVRHILGSLLLRVVSQQCAPVPPDADSIVSKSAAQALAAVPDALLGGLQLELGVLVSTTVGDSARSVLLALLRGLVSSSSTLPEGLSSAETCGRSTLPMNALQLTLGVVRSVWVLGASEDSLGSLWLELLPTLQDIHRRPYLPRRATVSALLCAAYSTALFSEGPVMLERYAEVRNEILSYASARATMLLDAAEETGAKAKETPWLWLHVFVLERFWQSKLPHGDAIISASLAALERGGKDVSEQGAIDSVAAVALLAALAPKCAGRRAELFVALQRATFQKPKSVDDERFMICSLDGLGVWTRPRNQEYDDLHRVEREGLGRVLEWRDTIAVFLTAKWRALAALARHDDLAREWDSAGATSVSLRDLAQALTADFETLSPPHIAYWAVVARYLIYPVIFTEDASRVEEQSEALALFCSGLSGAIANGTGDGAAFMPRGCAAELAAALCDPLLCQAERRVCAAKPDAPRPLTSAVAKLLSTICETTVGISRGVVVPLLCSLLCPPRAYGEDASAIEASADLLATLLLHKEATIMDGALSHAPEAAAGIMDVSGVGGAASLERTCPGAGALCAKFCGTSGLPRILALAAMDTLTERAGGAMPALIAATLRKVLTVLRTTQEELLNPPGAKKSVANRPPTPMPLSQPHRLQLRGWQAVLILGCRADKATAEYLLPELFWHLAIPHVPDVRDYQELLGCLLCSKFCDLAIEPLIIPMLQNFDAPVQVSASLLVIGGYLFRSWAESAEISSQHFAQASALIVASAPYLSHNSAYVRGSVAWGLFQILDAPCSKAVLASLPAQDAVLLAEAHRFLATNGECIKMRKRLKPVFFDFDPMKHAAIECLTEKSVVLPSSDKVAARVEGQNDDHTIGNEDFIPNNTFLTHLKNEVAHEMENLWDRMDPTQYPSLSDHWLAHLDETVAQRAAAEKATAASGGEDSSAGGGAGGISGLQRKFVPLERAEAPRGAAIEVSSLDELTPAPASRRVRAPLIVIASLIDKAPNLAGLCRTCEIFNCQALCLPNLKITKDQAFQSMSVTAEKWLPLREVPRTSIRETLLSLRRQGYALVGVEQTHNSVQLDQWKFQKQTVILLGAEKEGIDAELLPLLDGCVEIPQSGQIRSLNVHVSGSLTIWEYTRQHLTAAGGQA